MPVRAATSRRVPKPGHVTLVLAIVFVTNRANNIALRLVLVPGGAPVVSAAPLAHEPIDEPMAVDTPKQRRSSRSRTKSPEPIIAKAQEPSLSFVEEEPEEDAATTHPDSQYEKIIDEMDVDDSTAQDDVNEDELLAEPEEQTEKPAEQALLAEGETKAEEKPTTDEENRGTKRRSDSPSKGNTPKKRQRLPPPNVEDFVNDEDEPELDESKLQLSWCK